MVGAGGSNERKDYDFVSFQIRVLYGFYLNINTYFDLKYTGQLGRCWLAFLGNQYFMTHLEGDIAKVGKRIFFSGSSGYHFEINLSKFFWSIDSEMFCEISVQEALQKQLPRSITLGVYSEPSQFAKICNGLERR